MKRDDIERIAKVVLRDYGLPFRLHTVTPVVAGRCAVGFADSYSGQPTVSVDVWCDDKASPHSVRESLKSGLNVSD